MDLYLETERLIVHFKNVTSQRVIETAGLKPAGQGTYTMRELLKYSMARN